jgi:hypothetical protein
VVLTPVHGFNTWLTESSSLVPVFLRDRMALQGEIERLEQALLVAERSELTERRLWEENNRLRGLLGAATEDRIAAAIVARPAELPYDLLQIDRGSNDGVEVGAPVFIGKDVVIGLVVHTAPQFSFVEMVTTPGFEASAFVSGANVLVTLEGIGGGVARVRVPQGVPLRAGNLVYLPSVEPGVFGRIAFVENEPTQPEQYGYVSPEIALSGLYQVAVGKQSQIAKSTEVVDERVMKLLEQQWQVRGITIGEIDDLRGSTTASTTVATSSEGAI